MTGYKISSATEQSAGNAAWSWLLASDPCCTFSEMERDWSHSQEMPSRDKSQHSEPFFFSTLICYGSRGWTADVRTFIVWKGDILPHPLISTWIPYLESKGESEPNHLWLSSPGSPCWTQSAVMTLTHIRSKQAERLPDPQGWLCGWKVWEACFSTHMFGCWQTQTANLGVGQFTKAGPSLQRAFQTERWKIELTQNNTCCTKMYKNNDDEWVTTKAVLLNNTLQSRAIFTEHSKRSAINPNFRLSVTLCSRWEKKPFVFTETVKIWWTLASYSTKLN